MKENGYIFKSKSDFKKNNNFNYYLKAYHSLIYEWAKDFYTPYSFLQKILEDFSYIIKDQIYLIEYKYSDILKIIQDDYKFYQEFYQKIYNKNKFAIRICLFKQDKISEVQTQLDKIFQPYITDQMIDIFLNTNAKALNFNDKNIDRGCLILIDIDKVNIKDQYEFESTLDHELNHYFEQIDPKIYKINKSAINIVLKYAKICEFDFNGSDFITHMFNDSEFITMCTDVCNCLEHEKISYYDWLNFTTSEYISNNKFLLLSEDLQNNLFFSFCCRVVSKARWQRLKQAVKKQLNTKGLNIFKNLKHYFIDKKLEKLL